jgi:hypothetical protein
LPFELCCELESFVGCFGTEFVECFYYLLAVFEESVGQDLLVPDSHEVRYEFYGMGCLQEFSLSLVGPLTQVVGIESDALEVVVGAGLKQLNALVECSGIPDVSLSQVIALLDAVDHRAVVSPDALPDATQCTHGVEAGAEVTVRMSCDDDVPQSASPFDFFRFNAEDFGHHPQALSHDAVGGNGFDSNCTGHVYEHFSFAAHSVARNLEFV